MDIPRKQKKSNWNLLALIASCAAGLAFAPAASMAQVPYNIDGTVPDVDCCSEFSDPSGNTKELGPVNGSGTKLGSISAQHSILGKYSD